jgi:hypothetical protein
MTTKRWKQQHSYVMGQVDEGEEMGLKEWAHYISGGSSAACEHAWVWLERKGIRCHG